MSLSKEVKSLLDMVYRVGARRFHELSPVQARRSFQKLQFAFRPEAPAVGSTTEVPIGRPDGSVLFARFYRPAQTASDECLPLLIYLHGGGWCVGDIDSYDVLCRELTNGGKCAVLSVDYRLAPENPFPAGLEDALLSFDWVSTNFALLNIDRERVGFGGDSAGGNLAIVAALTLRDRGDAKLKFLALIYPCTQMLSNRPSRNTYSDGFLLDSESLQWFFSRYLPDGQTNDWRASPMLADSLAGLPPMCLVTAEYDPLTDDCTAFAERVRLSGGEIELFEIPGMVHGFLTLGKLIPECATVLGLVSNSLGRAFWGECSVRGVHGE